MVNGLTVKNKTDRVEHCKDLIDQHSNSTILFSDEKLFVLQQPVNKQNDRLYFLTLQDIPKEKRAIKRCQNASSVMVWGGISKAGRLPLIFIYNGVKINTASTWITYLKL